LRERKVDFLPPTWTFPTTDRNLQSQIEEFISFMNSEEFPNVFTSGQGLWLAKPSDFCRGCGIEIVKTPEEIRRVSQLFANGYRIRDFDKEQNIEQSQDRTNDRTDSRNEGREKGNGFPQLKVQNLVLDIPPINPRFPYKTYNNIETNAKKEASVKPVKIIHYPNDT
jgi:hypothetical protein